MNEKNGHETFEGNGDEKQNQKNEELQDLELITNIKQSNTFISFIEIDNGLIYGDKENKVCFTFSPRGGCTITIQCFLDLVHLLEDSKKNTVWVHDYIHKYFHKYNEYTNINDLIKEKYTFIKFIMNPYIRAVSSFRFQEHNFTFREYLNQLIKDINFFSTHDKHHIKQQYIEGEEKIITKYIRINEHETYTITLKDGSNYVIDPNKYTSSHHGQKTNNTEFCGDVPKDLINKKLPQSYKYFYDEEIKKMVETFFKDDIEKYNFSFDSI